MMSTPVVSYSLDATYTQARSIKLPAEANNEICAVSKSSSVVSLCVRLYVSAAPQETTELAFLQRTSHLASDFNEFLAI